MSLSMTERISFKRFTKGEAAKHSQIRLNHRRIFILPSKGGLALGVVILLMLIASINYNNSMGFVFTFLLAAAAQASTFYSYKNLSGLVVSLSKSAPIFVGSSGRFSVLIKEPGLRQRWMIGVKHLKHTEITNLQNTDSKIISLPLTATKRGWYTPDTITLFSEFPFGFFRAWSPLKLNTPILIYPKPIDSDIAIPFGNSDEGHVSITSHDSGTEDFVGFKTYQVGDSYRHVNWKAFAAEKGLFSNEFNAEESATVWLDWAACSGLAVESAISQLCFWVLEAEKNNQHYGLRLPNQTIEPNSGLSHQHACLKSLALYVE